ADDAVYRRRQLIDHRCRLGMNDHANAEHGDVAEPEREPRDKAKLRNLDGTQSARRGIDAIANRAAGESREADIVPDGIAREAADRGDVIRHFVAADRLQRKVVVEGKREIGERNEQSGERELRPGYVREGVGDFLDLDVAENAVKDE